MPSLHCHAVGNVLGQRCHAMPCNATTTSATPYRDAVVSWWCDVGDGATAAGWHHDLVLDERVLCHCPIDVPTSDMAANLAWCDHEGNRVAMGLCSPPSESRRVSPCSHLDALAGDNSTISPCPTDVPMFPPEFSYWRWSPHVPLSPYLHAPVSFQCSHVLTWMLLLGTKSQVRCRGSAGTLTPRGM